MQNLAGSRLNLLLVLLLGTIQRRLGLSASNFNEMRSKESLIWPKLIVFDLDMCIWSPEMYELDEIPTTASIIRGKLKPDDAEGVIAVTSGYDQIRIFPDALAILQQYQRGEFPDTVRIAAASSADTPRAVSIGRAAMGLLEVVPGVTLRQTFARGWPIGFEGNLQLGRTPPLSSNKAETHFPLLKAATGIEYSDMVFFDDCNWGDHCANVAQACPGVVTQRTPRGLRRSEWDAALTSFRAAKDVKASGSS